MRLIRTWRRARMRGVVTATLAAVAASLLVLTPVAAHASGDRAGRTTTHRVHAPVLALNLLTASRHPHQSVVFNFRGTRLTGRVAHISVSFGDGTAATYHSGGARVAHVYKRAGIFHVRARLVQRNGGIASARRAVVVSGRNHVVLRSTVDRIRASRLAGLRPLSPHAEEIVVSSGSPAPRVGRTLLFAANGVAPQGLVMSVTSVRRSGSAYVVRGHDANLVTTYRAFRLAHTSVLGSRVQLSRRLPDGSLQRRTVSAKRVPFACDDPQRSAGISLEADLSDAKVDSSIDLGSQTVALGVRLNPVFSLSAGLSGSVRCSLAGGFGLNIPVGATGLVVEISPYFDFHASAQLSATASWSPEIYISIVHGRGVNKNWVQFVDHASVGAQGNAAVDVDGGLSISISLAKLIGAEAKVGPELHVSASATPGQACVGAHSDLRLEIDLFLHTLFGTKTANLYSGTFFPKQLFNKCTSSGTPSGSGAGTGGSAGGSGTSGGSSGGGSSPYFGPTTAETTGSVARTFTDYVHAGGTQGPDIGSNATVAVACRIIGFRVSDGNTWWYKVASSPWNGSFYVSSDAFYNNGATSGSLHGTPFVDESVPDCSGSAGSAPTPAPTPTPTPPGQAGTWSETPGSVAHTWTDYASAGGAQGPSLSAGAPVQISCVVQGFRVADGNTNWYRIASSPWNDQYYVSADAFYNNGSTSGSLKGTPFVDPSVAACGGGTSQPPPPPSGHDETTGSVAHTWTNYSNAGGTEGPQIGSNQTVTIACVVQGFRVADGNTNWYRIASAPWSSQYYVSADAFYNNGATSGSLHGTPFVDPAVPAC